MLGATTSAPSTQTEDIETGTLEVSPAREAIVAIKRASPSTDIRLLDRTEALVAARWTLTGAASSVHDFAFPSAKMGHSIQACAGVFYGLYAANAE
jgi:hypothetical protein